MAVAVDEVFALVSHAVLHGDTAAQRQDPLQAPLRHGLGVVKEPAQTVKRDLAVDRLENVKEPPAQIPASRLPTGSSHHRTLLRPTNCGRLLERPGERLSRCEPTADRTCFADG